MNARFIHSTASTDIRHWTQTNTPITLLQHPQLMSQSAKEDDALLNSSQANGNMINNQVGRDERVHLSEHDVIVDDMCRRPVPQNISEPFMADDVQFPAADDCSNWPQTKSDSLLQGASAAEKRSNILKKVRGAIFPLIVLGVILGLIIMLFIINSSPNEIPEIEDIQYDCPQECSVSLVESIPEKLVYPGNATQHPSTFSAWKQLVSEAQNSIHIASMYWTLRGMDVENPEGIVFPSQQGDEMFQLLKDAAQRGVRIQIAEDSGNGTHIETDVLRKLGDNVEVRYLNFTRMLGAGVLHTKFIISDLKSVYVGSANMDWRSLTQVKELGVHITNCTCCIIKDLHKIFEVYWIVGDNSSIPTDWPDSVSTHYNMTNPIRMSLSGDQKADVYLTSSPSQLAPPGRSVDIDTILAVMDAARSYIHIAVMDYYPVSLYMKGKKNFYWPVIDDKLKQLAFERNIKVRLLASFWNHTRPAMIGYLKSLDEFSDLIEVKAFIVPTYGDQKDIPFARVNHNKYMVTDNIAYIGTSNWSADYFVDTAGVGFVFNQTDMTNDTIRQQLAAVFQRDWDSDYSIPPGDIIL